MAQGNTEDEPTEPLFHYTKEEAFVNIVNTRKFRLSSIYYMDDKEELTFGFKMSQSLLKAAAATGNQLTRMFCEELVDEEDLKKIRSLFEFYSISFGLKDDPQQWEKYGDGGCGVAFGLAPAFFHPVPYDRRKQVRPDEHIYLGKVVYGDKAARARHSIVINEAVEAINRAHAAGSIRNGKEAQLFFNHMAAEMTVETLWNSVTTKESSWAHQNETRLLAMNNLKSPHLPIHNPAKPHVEIPQRLLKKHLVEVMVGPNADPAAEARFRQFLTVHGLGHVPVTRARQM